MDTTDNKTVDPKDSVTQPVSEAKTVVVAEPVTNKLPMGGVAYEPVSPTPNPTKAYSANWQDKIGKFASALGADFTNVSSAFELLVGEPNDDGLDTLGNEEYSPFGDIQTALVSKGISAPVAKLRKEVGALRSVKSANVSPPQVATAPQNQGAIHAGRSSLSLLPSVPDDIGLLEMLKVGGVLKPNTASVVSLVSAGLGNRFKIFNVLETVADAIETYAVSIDEPVGDVFLFVDSARKRHRYGEVLSVMGVAGDFVSSRRKNELFTKTDALLWTGLYKFQAQLKSWQDAWLQGGAVNPNILFTGIAAVLSGGMMPPGLNQPPDTAIVRDAAEGFINTVNKIFAGTAIPVARALAYDALQIKQTLTDSRIPTAMGLGNRDQMLKALKLDVAGDYARLEKNLAKYTLGVMQLPHVVSGNEEIAYLGDLLTLGLSIPWELVVTSKGSDPSKNSPADRIISNKNGDDDSDSGYNFEDVPMNTSNKGKTTSNKRGDRY